MARADPLLCRQTVVHDADECSQSLSGWQQQYQQLGRGAFLGRLTEIAQGDCALIREATNRHHLERMAVPAGGLVIGIAETLAAGSLFDRRPLTAQCLLVLEGGQEHELLAAGPTAMLGLHLGAASLAAIAASPQGQALGRLREAAARGPIVLAPALADAIRCDLGRAAEQPGDGLPRPHSLRSLACAQFARAE
ncbi:MAG: hypothetical protein KGL43_05600, partial [Burkholderiales bacterium]|nr:hypothetical protein [Burkholderiales bacterium]